MARKYALDLVAAERIGQDLSVRGWQPAAVLAWCGEQGYRGLDLRRIVRGWEKQERRG